MARNLCSGEWIDEDGRLHYIGELPNEIVIEPLVSVMSFQVFPKGWECPGCGAVWAPGIRECEHCKPLTFIQVNVAG